MHDVAVIGGGPSGSTAAALLARAGRDVLLLEKEKFPRFQIGESLLPYNMRIFERLGVAPKLRDRFIQKWGVEFITSGGGHRSLFHFDECFDPKYPMSYQVPRADFDQLLLNHAAESGASVEQGTEVVSARRRDGGGWDLRAVGPEGTRTVEARILIDASGRNGILARSLGGRKMDRSFRKAALYAHYKGVHREPGRDAGNLVVILLKDGWIWLIPFLDGTTSVGLVTEGEALRSQGLAPEEAMDKAVRCSPAARKLMKDAERLTEVRAASDWTYACETIAGREFLIAGDAAVFVDPVFSSGVLLAMRSGELAADCAVDAIKSNDFSPARFARYQREVLKHARSYYRMVVAFYDSGFARLSFGTDGDNPIRRAVLNFLAGDVDPAWPIWWRLQVFYLLAGIARRFDLGPAMDIAPTFGGEPAGGAAPATGEAGH